MRASSFLGPLGSNAAAALLFLLLSSSAPLPTASQGCASTCPPLDDTGKAIPSLCADSSVPTSYLDRSYDVCHPVPSDAGAVPASFRLSDYSDRIIVIANHYVGCNAGRRESGVFAHVAQKYTSRYGSSSSSSKVIFVTSLKGGSSCERWADIYQNDAAILFPDSGVASTDSPWTVSDTNYQLRDDFFTTPFGHPSYVILAPGGDGEMVVRHKFVGPCCGFVRYSDCQPDTARELDGTLSEALDGLLAEIGADEVPDSTSTTTTAATEPAVVTQPAGTEPTDPPSDDDCTVGEWSEWSPCSLDCGNVQGDQFRWRTVVDNRPTSGAAAITDEGEAIVTNEDGGSACPSPVETRSCTPGSAVGSVASSRSSANPDVSISFSSSSSCVPTCIPEFGSDNTAPEIHAVASGFSSPRDVAFHPTPGLHLGARSSGRNFHPEMGEEAWVANGGNHSVSIVASLGAGVHQSTISRRDRGYYHYMVNITALAFNTVPPEESGRDSNKETFNYFAVCNDNRNDYMGTKEPNYLMGPTLYDTDPSPTKRNLVNRLGQPCSTSEEECYLLHADMLHESPSCVGIAHDPEVDTAYGTVYWAFDADGDRTNGQLVRFDFQQPHGPGSMDHSVAAVRRYPEVELRRGPPGAHAGMVVHPARRELFISNPGDGTILAVKADSGTYSRTARTEYPIYSNSLPSFEYSIWECVDHRVFASGLDTPSGLALSPDGDRLFVAERGTGKIRAFDVETGVEVGSIDTGYGSINGMAFSPVTGILHFVDADANSLLAVKPTGTCDAEYPSLLSDGYRQSVVEATESLGPDFSVSKNYQCRVNPIPPNASLFDQVHVDTGYASDDPNVQSSMVGMDAAAALLANRTDCEYDSDLNFDALLLGGYYCHPCLPGDRPGDHGAMCDAGGKCSNVQWRGYVCDNHYIIKVDSATGSLSFHEPDGTEPISPQNIALEWGVTYRFTVMTTYDFVSIYPSADPAEPALSLPARDGPLLVSIDEKLVENSSIAGEGSKFDGKLYFRSCGSFPSGSVVGVALAGVPEEYYAPTIGEGVGGADSVTGRVSGDDGAGHDDVLLASSSAGRVQYASFVFALGSCALVVASMWY